jgi:hypothetical protein
LSIVYWELFKGTTLRDTGALYGGVCPSIKQEQPHPSKWGPLTLNKKCILGKVGAKALIKNIYPPPTSLGCHKTPKESKLLEVKPWQAALSKVFFFFFKL